MDWINWAVNACFGELAIGAGRAKGERVRIPP